MAVVMFGALTGCAGNVGGSAAPSVVPETSPPASTTPAISPGTADAQKRADQWLATASVPAGAVQVDRAPIAFQSYTGWPCPATVADERYWTIPDMSLSDAMTWMVENPTPGLIPNRTQAPDPAHEGSETGFGELPHRGALEGIVFTIDTLPSGGVAIRAEVGAAPADVPCPPPRGGGQWGEPGMG